MFLALKSKTFWDILRVVSISSNIRPLALRKYIFSIQGRGYKNQSSSLTVIAGLITSAINPLADKEGMSLWV